MIKASKIKDIKGNDVKKEYIFFIEVFFKIFLKLYVFTNESKKSPKLNGLINKHDFSKKSFYQINAFAFSIALSNPVISLPPAVA